MRVKFKISGIEFEATGEFTPGRQGCLTLSNGDPGYPDEGAEYTIETLTVGGANAMWLLDSNMAFRFDMFADGRVSYRNACDVISLVATVSAVKQARDDADCARWEDHQEQKESLSW